MLEIFKYVNHLNEEVVFNQEGYIADPKALKNYAWSYNSQYKKISSFEKKITKYSLPVLVYGANAAELADKLYEAMEKDILAGESGRLFVGDFYIRGYFTESKKRRYSADKTAISMELTFVSDTPRWTSEKPYVYRPANSGPAETKAYPYEYPYSYLANSEMQWLTNPSFTDVDFRLVVYGPIENPQFLIGGHVYKVNTSIHTNEYLTVDSREKIITKTNNKGVKVNEFAKRDTEHYIFEKIGPGESLIIPVTNCPFDLTMYVERSEPKWT